MDPGESIMSQIRRGSFAFVAVLALVLVGACSEGSPTSSRMGRVNLLLTDAPGDVVSAVVTIDRIYLQAHQTEDSPGGRVVLREEDVTTDLLTLVDDMQLLVDDLEIPAGNYRQLRFVITGGYIEVENEDGTTSIYASSPDYAGLPVDAVVAGALHMPSFAQSGLKVNLPNDLLVVGGDPVWVLVDFDVAQSFGHLAGQSGRWIMSPVVQATLIEPPAEEPEELPEVTP
jgi:hypothetical protein